MSKKIHQLSARQLTQWLYANNSAEMSQLAVCVATGEKPWLEIAAIVLKAAPEDGDDDLSMALATALDLNAENVLAEPWPFTLDLICHVSDDVNTYETSIKSLDFRIGKVEAIKNPALRSKAQECVDSLNANKKWMAHFYQAYDEDSAPAPFPVPPPSTATSPPN